MLKKDLVNCPYILRNVLSVVSKKSEPPGQLEEAVGNIRKELWVWQDNLRGYRHKFVDVYQSSINKASFAIDYLREETQGPERAGAIALSGLTGYIFGLRKGIIRRFFYTSCGALGMAAICYPNDAAEYADDLAQGAKHYFIIAYHFVFGETPKMPDWLPLISKPEVSNEEKTAVEHKTK